MSHCLVIKVLCSFATIHLYYHKPFCLSRTFFKFFQVFSTCKTQNGEGGIWTLAPLLTTYSLSRGAPSASLGTSPNCPRCFLLFTRSVIHYITSFSILSSIILTFFTSFSSARRTERVGFEPTRPCGQTVFKTASLWPLRYLSLCNSAFSDVFLVDANYILSPNLMPVKT